MSGGATHFDGHSKDGFDNHVHGKHSRHTKYDLPNTGHKDKHEIFINSDVHSSTEPLEHKYYSHIK